VSVTNKEKKMIIEQFKGCEFDNECPNCKKVTKMKMLNDGKVKCINCKAEMQPFDELYEEAKDLFKSIGFM